MNEILSNFKLTPFKESQIEIFTGSKHGLKHLKSQRKIPVIIPKKVGRNDLCSCGSVIKFKKCCGVLN